MGTAKEIVVILGNLIIILIFGFFAIPLFLAFGYVVVVYALMIWQVLWSTVTR
jgi:hypothetical protein